MRRIVTLFSIGLVLALAFCSAQPSVGRAEPPQQKKRPKAVRKNTAGAVDGAIWSFLATSRTSKQIRFRYRAADLILYDTETNEVIGKSVGSPSGISRVTFNNKSKFPATFDIHHLKGPNWKGVADFQGQSWTVALEGVMK